MNIIAHNGARPLKTTKSVFQKTVPIIFFKIYKFGISGHLNVSRGGSWKASRA